MELTPDQKQRIEDEERTRLAEERYRAQVRARLDSGNSPTSVGSRLLYPDSEPVEQSHLGLILAIVAIVVVGGFLLVRLNRPSPDPGDSAAGAPAIGFAPRTRYAPVTQSIASGQITVQARNYWQYRIQITPEMQSPHLTGTFNVSGGSGNDIDAVVADENEFSNWINGHQAKVYYGTDGKKTTDTFDVRLSPGTYILAFSNKFGLLQNKYVALQVDLKYSRMETY
jgi:hypothetical protein